MLQLHMMFAGNIVGPNSTNELYGQSSLTGYVSLLTKQDHALKAAPGSAIGVIHDWYPQNNTEYNLLQMLHSQKSRLNIPLMQFGECLHGVGSYKQTMFPQSIGLSASFDTGLVHRVGRAIGTEARSIGIHACLSPVLDLGLEVRRVFLH